MQNKIPFIFLILGLLALLLGAFFGVMLSVQYLFPDFLKEVIAFNKMRPFHVTTVVGWIILTATGGIYYYVTKVLGLVWFSTRLIKTHLILLLSCVLAIYLSYSLGIMGGREYVAYFPLISVPILVAWILFGINFFKTIFNQVQNWPVYLWMWGTGIVFMIYHFTEAHLWVLPYFRENFIRDITVQWKSYGSFVGSWNMLLYGTAIFLMSKIKNDEGVAKGKKVFFFYFLGLTNLMFGWAHHAYFIPTAPWVRYIAYVISMTEWVVLITMFIAWKKSLKAEEINKNVLSFKFLKAMDFWVFFNLIAALLISIPYINFFTHGTHITVAHSMGTTIGINTMILLASVLFIANKTSESIIQKNKNMIIRGFWVFNSSLFVFLTCLFLAGVKKSIWLFFTKDPLHFSGMQDSLHPIMVVFFVAGLGVFTGLSLISFPVIKVFLNRLKN